MIWKTPKIAEVPVGMEINMYACAARNQTASKRSARLWRALSLRAVAGVRFYDRFRLYANDWNQTDLGTVFARDGNRALVWAVPAMIAVGVTGYYLVAVAKLVDAALGLAMPTDVPLDRRRKFKVIEGWENSSYSARKSLNPDQLSPRRRNVH